MDLEEIRQLEEIQTFVQMDESADTPAMDSKWVFKTKRDPAGIALKYKARVVARGFTQVEGEDYDQVFAPVLGMEGLRLILSIGVEKGWYIETFDVTGAYL